jgi:tetratricopeptide (TPR) repeat protein
MYIRPRKRKKINLWLVLLLLVLIVIMGYVYTRVQPQEIENPFVPTPTSTRSAFSYITEADGLYLQGDLERAMAAYEQVLQITPDDYMIYVRLARLHVFRGELRQALETAEQALELAPEEAPPWAVLCMVYDWSGRVPEAIDACRRAVDLDPAYFPAYAYLAEAYVDATLWNEAVEAGQRALELAPQSVDGVDAYRDYGYVLEVLGNYSGAVEYYGQALELHPNLPHLHVDIGRNYLAVADTASAIQAFERAVELDPARADALDWLGRTYLAIEDYDRAQDYFEDAIQVDPDYAAAYGHLALVFYGRRNYEDAILHFEETIALDYQAARRAARGFYVTVESNQELGDHASPEVVLRGEVEWADDEGATLVATMEPEMTTGRWADATGQLTMNNESGEYTLSLEGMPTLSFNEVYVGWFDGLRTLGELPLNTGPLRTEGGTLEVQLLAEPVSGPRIAHFYTLGRCYYFMDRCELAYPMFDAALQIDPENEIALEGIELCREVEGTPATNP